MTTKQRVPALAPEGHEPPTHRSPHEGGYEITVFHDGYGQRRVLAVLDGANIREFDRSHSSRVAYVEVHGATTDDEGDHRLIWRGELVISRITLDGSSFSVYGVLTRVGYQDPDEMADTSNVVYQGEWQDVGQQVWLDVRQRQ